MPDKPFSGPPLDAEKIKEMKTNKTVENIVMDNLATLANPREWETFSLRRSFNTNLMRYSNMKLFDLPSGRRICTVEVQVDNSKAGGDGRRAITFMLDGTTLVPLKTHVLDNKKEVPVFELSEDRSSYEFKSTLADYVLSNIPDEVILTRVVSDEEAQKYRTGGKLGSVLELFWKEGTVHTALHNVTSEFVNHKNYTKLVKFKFSKNKLKELLSSGAIEISTYDWVFIDRDKNSPFPFEVEITFNSQAHEALMQAYKDGQIEQGGYAEENPLANYPAK